MTTLRTNYFGRNDNGHVFDDWDDAKDASERCADLFLKSGHDVTVVYNLKFDEIYIDIKPLRDDE